ncbi:uncharacterized protein PHACADRAFT_247854 [Phanerochaete carnosa HHB-10118-sp]|uniref:Condensation domain-containing protein n=1 Tax=Phanerochaete carnosa (strain HHB-10118-sp) TaxID=650164 RepID=K5WPG6_PHACS|nr:uncharacterized protein PHACADRAFT_247854 [Phanerochaete carnosa HHB-10118-sp]EKM61320.1 hypothetical protein PHACADRAFT_247854 [Phanerochaete carnosa HHB-10118-sp]
MGRFVDVADPVLLTPPLDGEDLPAACVGVSSNEPSKALGALFYERKMGDTELSYYLPSRQSGVNDMYLHLGFNAPDHLVGHSRVRTVWAILRARHPLLSAHVQMYDYDDVRFVYRVPVSPDDVLRDAETSLEYRTQCKAELIDSYLNGPRTLSNSRLSYLVISHGEEDPATSLLTPPRTPSPSYESLKSTAALNNEDGLPHSQFDILICAMHFIGDGMALHTFANDFLGLLGSEKSDAELEAMLHAEWTERWQDSHHDSSMLPAALEDNIPMTWSKLRSAAATVDFQMSQQKLIGGQAFPRRKHLERRTIVPTISFPEDRTKAMLKKCKAKGVSISAALFAICNVAWARTSDGSKELPSLMYSALNLRPYSTVKRPSLRDSYWFLSIGYFNVILPSFVSEDRTRAEITFWHRARQAKEQSARAAKHPLLISRTQEMAKERGARARAWGKEDDEKEKGTWTPPTPSANTEPPREPVLPARAKVPSTALIGLSLLGNLDGMYKHANFSRIKLHTLTTGSRQRQGAMLLFGYTFVGRLWVSLGYDENGFSEGVVDKFWTECLQAIEEFLG